MKYLFLPILLVGIFISAHSFAIGSKDFSGCINTDQKRFSVLMGQLGSFNTVGISPLNAQADCPLPQTVKLYLL